MEYLSEDYEVKVGDLIVDHCRNETFLVIKIITQHQLWYPDLVDCETYPLDYENHKIITSASCHPGGFRDFRRGELMRMLELRRKTLQWIQRK